MGVKRIRDEAEYKSGGNSDFIGLDEGEKFVGFFLGQADPKIDDPAFFPYKMHWNGKTSVPCADEDCIYCEDGDRPRSKAYTLWLVTMDEAGKKLGKPAGSGELRIFDMPVTVIKQFNEMRAEGDKVQGKEFRVSRPDEKTYVLVPKDTKALTKSQINEHLKSDDAPDFEQMLNNKLKKAMEGTAVQRALEDDDDEPANRSGDKAGKKGKGKAAPEPDETEDDETPTDEEPGEWPDEGLDEETVTVAKKPKKDEFVTVESESYEGTIDVYTHDDIEFDLTDLDKGDEIVISTGEKDADGDYILSAEPVPAEADPEEEGEGGSGDDLPDSIDGAEMTVTAVDEPNSTMDVEDGELQFTLYFLDTMKIDFDDFSEGDKITVTAEKDRAGDLVATEVPEKVGGKKKAAPKKGGKKAPAKKKGK